MGRTTMGAVVSLDGYIEDDKDEVGPLFDWYNNGEAEWRFSERQPDPCRTTQASKDFMQDVYPRIGAVVIGRRLFDLTDGWGGVPAAGDHVFVVTHTPPSDWTYAGSAPFTFVTDGVEAAVAQAREFAGHDRDVDVAAGQIGRDREVPHVTIFRSSQQRHERIARRLGGPAPRAGSTGRKIRRSGIGPRAEASRFPTVDASRPHR